MSARRRYCFELQVKPDRIEEYKERHAAVWPEMLRALKASGWHNYSLFMRPDGAGLAELARLVENGKLEPVIDRVVPFPEIGQAFAFLEAGRAKGKVVVRMD